MHLEKSLLEFRLLIQTKIMLSVILSFVITLVGVGFASSVFLALKAIRRLKKLHPETWKTFENSDFLEMGVVRDLHFVKWFTSDKVFALNDDELNKIRKQWLIVRWLSAILFLIFVVFILAFVV